MSDILINLLSKSLGDTIALMPVVEEFQKNNNNVLVSVNPNFHKLFFESYPNIKFYNEGMSYGKKIDVGFNFSKPMQHGFAEQLGFMEWNYIRPKVDSFKKSRPIKNKFVCLGVHSTAQLKYWNHPTGKMSQQITPYWNELSGMIRKDGITPVVVEKDELFGVSPHYNGLPSKAQKKIGLNLIDTINYIEHSEFFIGLSSGLSWLAHALGKPVVMIANFSEEFHEFGDSSDYIRITNKQVCHGCWNKVGKGLNFDSNDWYWCPLHKDTDRQFECHTSITPTMVYDKIKHLLK